GSGADPAMMAEVDCNSNSLNAELEVRSCRSWSGNWSGRMSSCGPGERLLRRPACGRLIAPAYGGFCLSSPLPSLLCPPSLGRSRPRRSLSIIFPPAQRRGRGECGCGEAEDGSEPSVLDELEVLDLNSLSLLR
ncbi:Inhibin beta B chain, partial [Nibea albiflora]